MKSNKHILMILENSGFPEDTRVWMEATSLVEEGYRVSLISPTGKRKKSYELVDGVHVFRYPAPWEFSGFWGYIYEYGYSFICAFLLSLWVRIRHGFDAIHVHCPPDLNCMVAIFHRILGSKFVFDLHDLSPELYQAQKNNQGSSKVKQALIYFESLACRHADALIATNQSQQIIQIERGGAMPHRCYIVRNGPNQAFTKDGIEKLPELQKAGKTIIGYVGTMGIQDGVDSLIRALELLCRKRQDFHAYLIGNGGAVSTLKQMVIDLKLESYITFTGFVPFEQVPRYIATFDICTTPDPSNPYNDSCTTIKTMEYMALGRPTVSFHTPENELSAGSSAAYADDLDHFAELLSNLIDDPIRREQMGQRGKHRVLDHLAWKYQRQVLVKLYGDLFAGQHREVTKLVTSNLHSDRHAETVSSRDNSQHESTLPQEPPLDSCHLPVRFCYDGIIADYLKQELERDLCNSYLSPSFRTFYKLRPLIPGRLRQWAQTRRNLSLTNNPRWFIPEGLERKISELDEPLESIWPQQAEYALVLTHDVEEQIGFDNILKVAELEERLGFRSCWNIVPHKYRVDSGVLRELDRRGHEVAVHGYNHDGRLFMSKKMFDSRVSAINKAGADWNARGFRSPMVHRNLTWMQSLQFEYDSSCFDVDPFQAMPGGVGGIWPFQVGNLVELPYTLPQDHTLFVTLKENSTRIWRDKLQFIRKHYGMALMLTHPDYLIGMNQLGLYEEFLEHTLDSGSSWKVLPRELASWFRGIVANSRRLADFNKPTERLNS